MKTPSLTLRVALALLLVLAFFGPGEETAHAAPAAYLPPASLHANKLFDYIRGNRSRMVQVSTIGLGIGLVILMTATRKT